MKQLKLFGRFMVKWSGKAAAVTALDSSSFTSDGTRNAVCIALCEVFLFSLRDSLDLTQKCIWLSANDICNEISIKQQTSAGDDRFTTQRFANALSC